jgi:peptide deformylase
MSPKRESGTVPSEFDLQAWLAGTTILPAIVQAGDVVLRQRACEVPAALLGTPALHSLVSIMIEAMRRAPGVGLAAPQIGVPLRLFVAEDQEERVEQIPAETREERGRVALPLVVVVNPTVVADGKEQATFYEGCLSVRGYGALVTRANAVKVSGTDHEGRELSLRLEGWPARIMQHEMDHLEGTLYVDRMLTRSFASEGELARLSSEPVSDVLDELVAPPKFPSGV